MCNNTNNNALSLNNNKIIVTIITDETINSLELSNLMGYLKREGYHSSNDNTYVIKDRYKGDGVIYGSWEYRKIMNEISKLDFNGNKQVYVIDIR